MGATVFHEGKAVISGAMLPAPYGSWGMPSEVLNTLPGYSGDLAARQGEARRIMESLGYGPGKRLKIKVSTRDWQTYRDRAVILVIRLAGRKQTGSACLGPGSQDRCATEEKYEFPPKPPRMRWATYNRLLEQYDELENAADARWAIRIMTRFARY